jgi:hypothetical protein
LTTVHNTSPEEPNDVLVADFGDHGGLAFDLCSRLCMRLNPSGLRLLSLLRCGLTLDEAAEVLAREFDVPPEQARADAREGAELLQGAGLLAAKGLEGEENGTKP